MKKGDRGFHDLDERQLKQLDEHFAQVSPPKDPEEAQGKLRRIASKFKLTVRRPTRA
jgi:hypothetical protein